MEVYLDHSATTRCYPEVADVVYHVMMEDYGNPSSLHAKGVEAERYLREARERIAGNLKVSEKEILFTSGGTESNNLALIGAAMANRRRGNRIITTQIEHAAVGEPMQFLKNQGFELILLPVDQQGVLAMDALADALTPDTILVSTMYVNNEVGSVAPVSEIGQMIRKKSPLALYHVDAIQAYGKYRIHPRKAHIDLLSVSGHKIHGPKGTGFLYVQEKARIQPQILGGGQQNGMRSGTDNVPGIAGLSKAVELTYQNFEEKIRTLYARKDYFVRGLKQLEHVVVNGMPVPEGAPHIISASFMGIRSEVLLHALEERGIYISAGSACSAHKKTDSATLTAMGMQKAQIESTVRFSFDEEVTREQIDYCLQVLAELLPQLRRFTRR